MKNKLPLSNDEIVMLAKLFVLPVTSLSNLIIGETMFFSTEFCNDLLGPVSLLIFIFIKSLRTQ